MKDILWESNTRNKVLLTSAALSITAGALATLGRYVQQEYLRRKYPDWEDCQCAFKSQQAIFQVWHSRHEQRGETIVAQEWGLYLSNPPAWLRRFLHHSAQVIAILNPTGGYVERITLNPQEAYQFAVLLKSTGTDEGAEDEETVVEGGHIIWRREILHAPRALFDSCTRRLYPIHIGQDRQMQIEALPALWDPESNLPLPSEGPLLDTPIGTRVDCIGWTPTQISYCTARLQGSEQQSGERSNLAHNLDTI